MQSREAPLSSKGVVLWRNQAHGKITVQPASERHEFELNAEIWTSFPFLSLWVHKKRWTKPESFSGNRWLSRVGYKGIWGGNTCHSLSDSRHTLPPRGPILAFIHSMYLLETSVPLIWHVQMCGWCKLSHSYYSLIFNYRDLTLSIASYISL
jgi:hypothetical protein